MGGGIQGTGSIALKSSGHVSVTTSSEGNGKPTILIADDTPANLLAYESMLGDLGANLVLTNSGAETLRYLLKNSASLIILDVQMPDLDGIETAALIRGRDKTRQTPIIFATGNDLDGRLTESGYDLGAADYIIKPLNPKFFRAKVQVFVELAEKSHKIAEQAKQLRDNCDELSRSNREFHNFAYAAAHDLKAPLRQVTAFCEMLEARADGESTVFIGHILAGTRRMRELIDHLFMYSRAGQGDLIVAQTCLAQVLKDVLADMAEDVNTSHARISVGKLPTVDADPVQLYQVFQNLVSNALKYRRPGTYPTIDISCVELPEQAALTRRAQLRVQDDGIGFRQSEAEDIFQPFRRLVSQDNYEGSGIGLATARRIVERHNGSLEATSHPNDGSTFTVTLPFEHR